MACCWIHIFAALSVYYLSSGCHAALYGESCQGNEDCKNIFTYCKIISSTCGHGTCTCLPGYGLDAAQCKQKRYYGESCDPTTATTMCTGLDNLECSSDTKKCECTVGYRYGPDGIDTFGCIPETMNVTLDMKCYDDIQCLFGMSCHENICKCQVWQKPMGPYACVQRRYGDPCQSDNECSAIPNSKCGRVDVKTIRPGQRPIVTGVDVCKCADNTRNYVYMDDYGIKQSVCMNVPSRHRLNNKTQLLGTEAQNCNIWQSRGPLFPCRMPFLCTFCGNNRTICAKPNAIYATAANAPVTNFVVVVTGLVFSLIISN